MSANKNYQTHEVYERSTGKLYGTYGTAIEAQKVVNKLNKQDDKKYSFRTICHIVRSN